MTFRHRLTLASAAAVAVAIVLAAAVIYPVVRSRLLGQLDGELERSAFRVVITIGVAGGLSVELPPQDPSFGGVAQVILPDGTVNVPPGGARTLPVGAREIAVARGDATAFFSDSIYAGVPVRVYTAPLPGPGPGNAGIGAVQVARSLQDVNDTLGRLRAILVLVTFGGIAAAIALGVAVTRTAVAPVRRLTEAAEHVTATGDLTRRIDEGGDDELGRLGATFNRMLQALEASVATQRQLVADASHELRTPLASLRVNADVLAQGNGLGLRERTRIAADIAAQVEELSAVVADVIELARGSDRQAALVDDVCFDALVAGAVDRAGRRAPGVRFTTSLDPTLVRGSSDQLERAVSNLFDNAIKWSPPGGEVEVSLRHGELSVRDHGPGIAPADLPFVFDRFYRAPSARGKPGSGLGLAIVRQVALAHAGSVHAEPADGGGTRFRLSLPVAPSSAPSASS